VKAAGKRTIQRLSVEPPVDIPQVPDAACIDETLVKQIKTLLFQGLSPPTALSILAELLAAAPRADKEDLDRLKTMDKLLNTARAMMETRVKLEEVQEISQRLDEIERRIGSEKDSFHPEPFE
jgi:hypothetical protein